MSNRIQKFVEAMHVQPNDRILEIGCGHGIAASLICRQLKNGIYVGIDRSPKMIAVAAKRNAEFVNVSRAAFVLASLESFDPGLQRFDKVFAMRVRIFHDNPLEAKRLTECWLARNGRLFVEYDEPLRTMVK
ncbi:class I SAM-dependent methyltransferase [Massilia sp. PAMC28688]|nr:class I SAM-dependent methyltransferase [Massilia sp. PAMC28688]QYF92226.1 class I SAM-dependent methyltransferase [Massilia sp. PAMC28688]